MFKRIQRVLRLPKEIRQLRAEMQASQTALNARFDGIEAVLAKIARTVAFEVLPATEYARFAMPLDYPPSRDLRPRWGYTRPPIEPLANWFREQRAEHLRLLSAMREHAVALSRIALDFDPKNLPEPAWRGVPFAPFDLAALYTIVAETRPKQYLEIGSGISTAFAHRAARDAGFDMEITSIDPEPRAAIDGICSRVVRSGLETCDLARIMRRGWWV